MLKVIKTIILIIAIIAAVLLVIAVLCDAIGYESLKRLFVIAVIILLAKD